MFVGFVQASSMLTKRATVVNRSRWCLSWARCAFQETSDNFFSTVTALLSGEWINESSWSWTSAEKSGPRSSYRLGAQILSAEAPEEWNRVGLATRLGVAAGPGVAEWVRDLLERSIEARPTLAESLRF